MARGLSIKFDTSAIRDRFKNYKNDLKTLLQSEWPMIVEECLADVLARTPDPGTEYSYLMGFEGAVGYGDNSTGESSRGRDNHTGASGYYASSSISARRYAKPSRSTRRLGNPSRLRFIRTPGLWLQDLIKDPATYKSSFKGNTFKINLGYVNALEKLSKFSWVNFQALSGQSIMHTSTYGTWSFFEYGLSNLVQPHRWSSSMASGVLRGNGLGYKLKPSDFEHYWAMMKHYPKARMYTGFQKSVFIAAVESRIRAVKF